MSNLKRILIVSAFAALNGCIPAIAAVNPPNAVDVVHREYDGIGVEKISIENGLGRIIVTASDRPRVVIQATKRVFTERCIFGTEKPGLSEIFARVQRPTGEPCEVDIQITAPKNISLNITSSSGAVDITGMEGRLALSTGSGAVNARGKFSDIVLKSGSGAVNVEGLTGGGQVSLGSGSVSLRYLDNPRGTLEVSSGSGGAQVFIPKDTKIKAQLATGSGEATNALATSETADLLLNVKTGAGNVEVKAY
jgi:hypothetical protein